MLLRIAGIQRNVRLAGETSQAAQFDLCGAYDKGLQNGFAHWAKGEFG